MNTRTSPLPPTDLADPIWTIEHVGHALRIGARASRTVVATTGFPTPFRLNQAPTARLYWMHEDLLAHFCALTAPAPAPTATRPKPAGQAAPVRPRRPAPDPDAAARAKMNALRATAGRVR